jgi:hypothetical protein
LATQAADGGNLLIDTEYENQARQELI